MSQRWSPLLDDQPELAAPLLGSVREALPVLFDLALQAPEAPTKPTAVAIAIDSDPSARLTVVGRDLRRAGHGPRDALFLRFDGQATFRNGTLRVVGDAVLDLATNAILRLRLTEPVVA